jgi:hypothetical protein
MIGLAWCVCALYCFTQLSKNFLWFLAGLIFVFNAVGAWYL